MNSQERLLDAERLPIPSVYIRQQFLFAQPGELDMFEPVTDAPEDQWEVVPTRDPNEFAEAIACVLDLYHDDHEVRLRTWIETIVR